MENRVYKNKCVFTSCCLVFVRNVPPLPSGCLNILKHFKAVWKRSCNVWKCWRNVRCRKNVGWYWKMSENIELACGGRSIKSCILDPELRRKLWSGSSNVRGKRRLPLSSRSTLDPLVVWDGGSAPVELSSIIPIPLLECIFTCTGSRRDHHMWGARYSSRDEFDIA